MRDSSYFLWLLFTLSTSHGQHYVPHERWFRNIHKDEGPVRDEVGSFTVSAPFEVLVYEGGGGGGGGGGGPAVCTLKPLTCAGLTAQMGEIQYPSQLCHRCVIWLSCFSVKRLSH